MTKKAVVKKFPSARLEIFQVGQKLKHFTIEKKSGNILYYLVTDKVIDRYWEMNPPPTHNNTEGSYI